MLLIEPLRTQQDLTDRDCRNLRLIDGKWRGLRLEGGTWWLYTGIVVKGADIGYDEREAFEDGNQAVKAIHAKNA